ncbi:MaoC/PaaZ C-terminal domain-containing protein [Aeromicrobium ponti]|uniref:Acyl dehydratase n=1 Tax=Cytobacillus oceanisediminis TaxID=665099 RepID=A0A562JRA1_9BACI|nr:MaoC/PaaZ C-terminal domain-containing protein [Cytobacillus oceanisediminis]TWH85717.1 acyl dehydratase [Cytobacillus oceanisediminis]
MAIQVEQRYFDEIELGEITVSEGRTITEGDVVNFACLTGDFNQLHMDAEFMKNSAFGQRIAHGLLIMSIQQGLGFYLPQPDLAIMAFMGVQDWSFKKPVFIGDTVHVKMEIIEKKETSKPDRGIIVRSHKVYNQHEEIVQEGKELLMIHRKS